MTPLDLLAAAIRARASAPGSLVPPAAILWTDARREWGSLLPAARLHVPELVVLGDYSPDDRAGPAIWLRCVVDHTIELPDFPSARPPIIYMPGVEREQLRAGEACPEALRPVVELMYRGLVWHHPNGRDWSVRAFLMLRGDGIPAGPGLDIASDSDTGAALLRAIGEVAQTPVEELQGRRLGANDFNRLVGVDVVRDILRWIGSPKSTCDQMDETRWDAFCDEARRELSFDPATGADVEAGARLAEGRGRWEDAWVRFTEAPRRFPGIAEVLGRSRPDGTLVFDGRDRWPELNEEDETAVRNVLAELPDLPQRDACRKVQQLEADHGCRREWVWAGMGRSPLAQVLSPLARLAAAADKSIGGALPDDIARVYAERGWQADRGAREALAIATPENEQVVAKAVRHLLKPWLHELARTFQAAVRNHPLRFTDAEAAEVAPPTSPVTAAEGECLLFVDGLRYELGHCLRARLEGHGLAAIMHSRWGAIPTVTATAKPAVTPVASDIAGDEIGAEFLPVLRDPRRPARTPALRNAMRERGYGIIGDGVLELGPAVRARAWGETGAIDRHGHHHGATGFARQVKDELDRLVRRVTELLDAGWRSVRIVTDHGWLLLPGGLPMVTLPRHLTESQWARCAVPAGDSRPDAPLYPWHWNESEHFASPPGIACFSNRPEYAHGGLSVQECLIPDIRVSKTTGSDSGAAHTAAARAVIRSVSWVRMRCNILVDVPVDDATADLRLGSPSGESVASSPKAIDADGCASLILRDDAHEDAALVLVVTASDGRILAQRATRKGEPSA